MAAFKWYLVLSFVAFAAPAFSQLAPTGEHYAGRASDTGYFGGLINATGAYPATIPLDLPAARGGLPVPLQIVYRSHGVGAAGLGWDIPLSYIQRDRTFAHRRPLSGANMLPVPRERAYLSLSGQNIELQHQGNSNEWRALSGTHALNVREGSGSWQLDDGTGRLYTFSRLGATGMWLLQSVSAPGGTRVELTYETVPQTFAGGSGTQVSLTRLRYNPHPTTIGCWKNEVVLAYEFGSPRPLSLSVLGGGILVRRKLLTRVDVESRATCTTPFERLRRYQFEYPNESADPDTGLPRLRSVREFGRQGTSEENTSLPIAAYDYATATQDGALRYQTTQQITLPADIAHDEVSSTVEDESVSTPATGKPYAMWQSLTDVNGDGRPDLIFKKNNKLWVAYNQPSSGGTSTIGVGQAIAQLSDATLTNGPVAAHTSTQPRFNYAPAKTNVVYVWRQAIDLNGDGRVDIIDASEQPDHWVVYLNTPGPQGTVKWQRRSYSVQALRTTLKSFGHLVPNVHVPLSQRVTGTNLKIWECWKYIGNHQWSWYSEGFANHACEGFDGALDGSSVERGPERTFVQWELKDINGDGYPDVVFNSSPVTYQLYPPHVCTISNLSVGALCGLAVGLNDKILVPFAPGPNNAIRAMFNVLGIRFYTDDNPFGRSFDLFAPGAEQGVDQWRCSNSDPNDLTCPDENLQSQFASLVDVNGDGLADRVVNRQVYLGTYTGTAATFSGVYLTLPGPLATQKSTVKTTCVPGNPHEPEAQQIQGLRDLTGDGIPDYIDLGENHTSPVWVGTSTGFFHGVGIVMSGANFRFSHENERCDGLASITDGGLFDIDGDGRPEVIGLLPGNIWVISQLTNGGLPGAPDAGRLTHIENGYGAVTHISYVSAKSFTDNLVPFPEIVVSSVEVTSTQNLGGTLAGTRYAYSNAELVFDSMQDRFIFPGYRRFVDISLSPAPGNIIDSGDRKLIGSATILDAWPLTDFQPGLSKHDRWLRMERMGRLRDVMTLRGSGTVDPWELLSIDSNDTRVIGNTHTDWDTRLFESPPNLTPGLANCIEMVNPFDFQVSLANAGPNFFNICGGHGFVFPTVTESWYGGAPPPSDDNVQTRSQTLAVDDLGRPTITEYDNDLYRGDDDLCVENAFAAPSAAFPRVLNALSKRRVYACGKNITFASESWGYDDLPVGSVSSGRMTSHSVDRRATDTGDLLNTVHVFDVGYDAVGNPATVRTQRGSSTRTVTLSYDSFGLVPTHTKLTATGVPSIDHFAGYDPVSLNATSSTDANQTKRGIDLDGFGRPLRATVTVLGSSLKVVSTTSYLGFDSSDPDGRRIILRRFSDPVVPANISTANGRAVTVFLDELGRTRRSELALGSDYANDVLVLGLRAYDDAGRVVFEADPYPKSQNPAPAYGTSYYFKNTGDLDCVIRGRGRQALTIVTDVATETFPTCFQRSFANHLETLDVHDPASLQAGSAQSGVVKRIVGTATGRVIERSTLKAGLRLEDAVFGYDRLGQQTSMVRFLDPIGTTGTVQWSLQLDSIGQTLQLAEPNAATRRYSYSDWAEPIETQWVDGAVNRQLLRSYDALSRPSAAAERNDGITDPETVYTYTYDTGVNVSQLVAPTFVLGRLARATSPSGQVTFSYDAFGRVNAQVFTDSQGGLYVEKAERHADGRLDSLEFNLPDQNYDKELVKYAYDSAGRVRTVNYADPSGVRELYNGADIDLLGRVRKVVYAGNTVFHAAYADEGRRLIKEEAIESPFGSRRISFEQYDPIGRELSRRESKDGSTTGPKTNVAYDVLGRLGHALSTDGATTIFDWVYSYDALGNLHVLRDLLGTAGATISYGSADRDRICRIGYGTGGLGGTACNVAFNAVGNIIEQLTRTGQRTVGYFNSGKVRSIDQSGAQARFRYDAFGNVHQLDVTGLGVPFVRHDLRYGGLIERRDLVVNGTPTTFLSRNIPMPTGEIFASRRTKKNWVFQFGELRGTRFFTNQDGELVQDIDYQPFGEAASTGAASGTDEYTSHQWNRGDTLAPFGLVQLGARIYDPVIGRFLSRDPFRVLRTASNSNPYAFSANDPLNAADPSGLDCIGEGCNPDVPITPFVLIAGIVNGLNGSGSGGASPAPAVTSGPQADLHRVATTQENDDTWIENVKTGLEWGGTGLTLGAHALKHGSEAQIFTEWGGSTAHYANILISSWEFGKDPGLRTGYNLVSAGVDKYLVESGPAGWAAYGAKGWLGMWWDAYAGDSWDKAIDEEVLRADARYRAREAARAAEQRQRELQQREEKLEYQKYMLESQRLLQDFWDEVGPTLVCTEETVCELPVYGPQEQ